MASTLYCVTELVCLVRLFLKTYTNQYGVRSQTQSAPTGRVQLHFSHDSHFKKEVIDLQ